MSNSFFGDVDPTQSAGNYIKWNSGDKKKLRIITAPFWCHQGWGIEDGRPYRAIEEKDLPDNLKDIKRQMCVVVWDYESAAWSLWSITQRSVMNDLYYLSKDEDYGDPREYDIKVERTGSGLDTRWKIIAGPVRSLSTELVAKKKNLKIDWEAYLNGDAPYTEAADEVEDLPF